MDPSDDLQRDRELHRIEEELARLPAGQLVERRRAGGTWIFRLYKEDGIDRWNSVGPPGGPQHRQALDHARSRRELSRRRREIARFQDAPVGRAGK